MTPDSISHHNSPPGFLTAGWLTSGLLHGGLVFAATLFVQHMQLAPEPEPFQWNVALVSPTPMTAPLTPEPIAPPAKPKTAPARAPQQSAQTTFVTTPVAAPPPKTDTPVVPPPPAVPPTIEKPMPVEPLPPHSGESTPPPAILSTPEPVHSPPREPAPPPAPMPKTEPTTIRSAPVLSPIPPAVTPLPPAPTTPAIQPMAPPLAALSNNPSSEPAPVAPAVPSTQFWPPPSQPSTSHSEAISPAHSEPIITREESLPSRQQPVSEPGPLVAALSPAAQPKPAKIDYGWLSDQMARWIEDLEKRYPAMLRSEGIQGKVTLIAVLHENGSLSDIRVAKSSGNAMLDQVAVEDVRKGPAIKLSRPLERPQMPLKFSIIYDLKTAR